MPSRSPFDLFTYYFLEVILTLAGLITVLTPLALWAVPQMGDMAIPVYYYVTSIGVGALAAVIGLSWLQRVLFPERARGGRAKNLDELRQARVDWEEEQEAKLKAGWRLRRGKGHAKRDLGQMLGIAALLGTAFLMIFLPSWALIEQGIAPKAGQTILIVDQDPGDRDRIRRLLLRSGFKVLEAQTVAEGLAHLGGEAEVDLVLADVMVLDGLRGVEMVRQVRQTLPDLKVVYTGQTADKWKIREELGEEAAVLWKPFLNTELRARVKTVLAGK